MLLRTPPRSRLPVTLARRSLIFTLREIDDATECRGDRAAPSWLRVQLDRTQHNCGAHFVCVVCSRVVWRMDEGLLCVLHGGECESMLRIGRSRGPRRDAAHVSGSRKN